MKESVQVIMALERWKRDGEQGKQVLMVVAEVDGRSERDGGDLGCDER
jgi:hypothetical protein